MIPVAAVCERNWNPLGSITGGKHARLSPEKAKVVYIRASQHLRIGRYDIHAKTFGLKVLRACSHLYGFPFM